MQAHAAHYRRKHPAHHRRSGRVFVKLSLCLVAPAIAIGRTATRDELAALNAGDASAYRPLAQLLTLNFGGKGLGATDELANCRVLEFLSDELQARSVVLDFF